ncbi:uncharacterized protein LOC103575935 [Microplitis demolitor]|uniref:uncharacterized protein LOC103575935 n=1 Tax=Microplitis demolitor TaxID=69319 RepID=UPI0004CD1060|nr:uncharacterized protein LOC103575935 [Microplitis demolitor]
MQTLRKKSSPCKFKKEPTRFLGEGISFKAKLIGILEVSEARGDRMCQAALADLKMAIRAAGEHKQRIIVQISIDGLRLRDEKSGECLYHHPVHKISFIAQDMTDSRAFGYIFGSPDTGHRFFGIKTDKAANQVVIAMRDLFQVVFELKKKEIEMAKQHIEQNVVKFHTSGIFVEPAPDTKGAAEIESCHQRQRSLSIENEKSADKTSDIRNGEIADLLDLQFELNSLQQGIHQMDKITPENCPLSTEDPSETDPFGDSFINLKIKESLQPILPPPPSCVKRGATERQPSEQMSSLTTSSPATVLPNTITQPSGAWSEKDVDKQFNDFEITKITASSSANDEERENEISPFTLRLRNDSPQIDVFTELDPLGTGLSKPYIDKKDFFQNLKNPPKKILKDLVTSSLNEIFPTTFHLSTNSLEPTCSNEEKLTNVIECDNFADFDHFDTLDNDFSSKKPSLPEEKPIIIQNQHLSVNLPPEECVATKLITNKGLEKLENEISLPSKTLLQTSIPTEYHSVEKKEFDIDSSITCKIERKHFSREFSSTNDSPASPLRSCSSEANSRLSSSSAELECVPEPPPRNAGCVVINPPPLPPKKQAGKTDPQPPPIPPHIESRFQYDFIKCERSAISPINTSGIENMNGIRSNHPFDNKEIPLSKVKESQESENTDVFFSLKLQESIRAITPSNLSSILQNSQINVDEYRTKSALNSTLSQLATSNLSDLAASLNMTVSELTNLTLHQLTRCLANYSLEGIYPFIPGEPNYIPKSLNENEKSSCTEKLKGESKSQGNFSNDKYAAIREILEIDQTKNNGSSNMNEKFNNFNNEQPSSQENDDREDKSNLKLNIEVDEKSLFYNLPNEKNESMEKELIAEKKRKESEKNTDDTSNNESQYTKSEMDKKFYEYVNNAKLKEPSPEKNKLTSSSLKTDGNRVISGVETISPSNTSNDKYAALREIISEVESINCELREKPGSSFRNLDESMKTSTDEDLMNLFSAPQSPCLGVIKGNVKDPSSTANITNRYEKIETPNKSSICTHAMESRNIGFDDVFHPFSESKQVTKDPTNNENWATFDMNVCKSEKQYGSHNSLEGNSPWSPDESKFHKLSRTIIARQSTGSDNDWKDDEESEESNDRFRNERFHPVKNPRLDAGCENVVCYNDGIGIIEKERYYRGRMNKKPHDGLWTKYGHRLKSEAIPWCDEGKWEEEHRKCTSRKTYFDEDNDRLSHWKCCNSQAIPWNGDRPMYAGNDMLYDNNRCNRRNKPWNDDDRERDRFSSQESMDCEDEERWPRCEFERRRREEDSRFWERYGAPSESDYPTLYRKYNHHYCRDSREQIQLDYSLGWEKDYLDRAENSRRHPMRKRCWPKRPNSANDERNTDLLYAEPNIKYGISRSECSDNDSEFYRFPYRSRSREHCWGIDQEFDSWNERSFRSEGPGMKNSTNYCKKTNRHKLPSKNVIKSRKSPFEDDFTQTIDNNLPPVQLTDQDTKIELDIFEGNKISSLMSKSEFERSNSKTYERPLELNEDSSPMRISPSEILEKQLDPDSKYNLKDSRHNLKDSIPTSNRTSDSSVQNSFLNGESKRSEDGFTLKSITPEDSFPDSYELTTNNLKQLKYANNKTKEGLDIKKSESINIFIRENDPFDDDEFFK